MSAFPHLSNSYRVCLPRTKRAEQHLSKQRKMVRRTSNESLDLQSVTRTCKDTAPTKPTSTDRLYRSMSSLRPLHTRSFCQRSKSGKQRNLERNTSDGSLDLKDLKQERVKQPIDKAPKQCLHESLSTISLKSPCTPRINNLSSRWVNSLDKECLHHSLSDLQLRKNGSRLVSRSKKDKHLSKNRARMVRNRSFDI